MSIFNPEIELSEGEVVIKKFSISKFFILILLFFVQTILVFAAYYLSSLINFFNINSSYIGIFANLTLLLISLIFFFYFLFYIPVSNIYVLTNKRIVVKRGWLSTETITGSYEKITDIYVSQTFIERFLFLTGTIKIDTAGDVGYEIVLSDVHNPEKLKAEILSLKDGKQIQSLDLE